MVAITGSYGKTTTKGYVAHLVGGTLSVVPSPKSFNNQTGLAKAINENLVPGTDVFVAEMGTYGPGEIAEMCAWIRPDIAVITSIGPVHLERMGTEQRIAAAKSEILQDAGVMVLNVDSPWLAAIADREAGRRARSCAARSADGRRRGGRRLRHRRRHMTSRVFVEGARRSADRLRPAASMPKRPTWPARWPSPSSSACPRPRSPVASRLCRPRPTAGR